MSDPVTLSIVGSVIGGAAQGWSAAKARKDEQEYEEKQQQKRTDSYRGLGESVRYWENDQGEQQQTPMEKIAAAPALGQQQNQVGQKYIDRAERNKTQGPRYKFDRTSGRLSYG